MGNGEYERAKDQLRTEAPDDGTYEYVDKNTGQVLQVPKGIDPGWDYNPGEAAWGRKLSDEAMLEYQAMKADAWESLTPGDWQTYGLPEKLPAIEPMEKLGPALSTMEETVASLTDIIGAEEKVFSFDSKGFRYDLLVNAEVLGRHIKPDRSPFLPFIPEVLIKPQEVWLRFERHKGTGKVVLRQRIIKVLGLEKEKAVLFIADARDGWLEALTMLPTRQGKYLNDQRAGQLVYGQE